METTNKIDNSLTGITENYNEAIINIIASIKKNNFVLKFDGLEANTNDLAIIRLKLTNLTKSARKNIAKRIWIYNQKRTIKAMNYLFHVLKKMDIIGCKIKVLPSIKEQTINKLRENYKLLRKQTEEARIAYKLEKGNFYKC